MVDRRRCPSCRIHKPFSHYYLRSNGEYTAYCKPCMKRKSAAWSNARRRSFIALVNEIKSQPCTDCGNTYPPYVMDFDHIGDNKTLGVSALVRQNASWEKIMEEIEKCELVCANCHRIRTHQRSMAQVM